MNPNTVRDDAVRLSTKKSGPAQEIKGLGCMPPKFMRRQLTTCNLRPQRHILVQKSNGMHTECAQYHIPDKCCANPASSSHTAFPREFRFSFEKAGVIVVLFHLAQIMLAHLIADLSANFEEIVSEMEGPMQDSSVSTFANARAPPYAPGGLEGHIPSLRAFPPIAFQLKRSDHRLALTRLAVYISTTYMRPGFAFGGSCLPKDVRALTYKGRLLDVETPVLSSILASNQVHIDRALTLIRETGRRRVGLLGLSFKEGTDDLRESPIVTLAEQLIGKGFELLIYDRNVKLATLVGSNLDYILNHIPHIGRVLVDDPLALFTESEVVVVATGEPEFANLVARNGSGKMIIDLAGIGEFSNPSTLKSVKSYEGIAWHSDPDHSRKSAVPVRPQGLAGGAGVAIEWLPGEYHLPEGARI
jgi:UDP-glucose/GDP-mannose dehydrogenase family, UDP binding domain/UDP-glucose/GDP-mannose dehydrogenase family, central domain